MSSKVCVSCLNHKVINLTSNRLVTELCGHVKCLDCLFNEKLGCAICINESNQTKSPDETRLEEKINSAPPEQSKENKKSDFNLDDIPHIQRLETSHIVTDPVGRCYICTVCKKKFHSRNQVTYHAYCNGQTKPFQCPECCKSFATQSHYKYHMRVHRNERTYACEICGESFFQMSKLQRHKLKHTMEKKYVCSVCSKAFNNLSSLRKHGLTHTEERPYTCSVCGYRFRDSSNYKKHLAKHNDNKNGGGAEARAPLRRSHPCPRCPQTFSLGKDLKRHIAVHTDSKPFGCKVCSRLFRRKDNLERHIRNTHSDVSINKIEAIVCLLDGDKRTNITQMSEKNTQEQDSNLEQSTNEKNTGEGVKKSTEEIEKMKLSIIEANNARESVIFGPMKRLSDEKKSPNHQIEYVHKIRKANSMLQKDVALPPIDESKIIELTQKKALNDMDGPPLKNVEIYKKILSAQAVKDAKSAQLEESGEGNALPNASPNMHWRRKMKLNIN